MTLQPEICTLLFPRQTEDLEKSYISFRNGVLSDSCLDGTEHCESAVWKLVQDCTGFERLFIDWGRHATDKAYFFSRKMVLKSIGIGSGHASNNIVMDFCSSTCCPPLLCGPLFMLLFKGMHKAH